MAREIWAADSETDPFKAGRIPTPFIWGAWNGSEYHQFNTTDEFVDFISQRECIVYAHNGGKFDWFFLLHRLTAWEPLMVISGRLAKFKIGLAEFRDSYNILPFPLAAYQKDEIDYAIMEKGERDEPANRKKIESYLKADCVYLWDIVTNFIERYGMNLTQASAAMKAWQRIADVKAPNTPHELYDDLKPYYYGGRVECFEVGEIAHPFKVIDINSAYPFAMKHLHPYGASYDIGEKLPKTRPYIERAFITLRAASQGAFPFADKSGLHFPNDGEIREFHVTGWEYLAAKETGRLSAHEIIEVVTFADSIRFDDYIDHFYKLKKESKHKGDKAGYIFAKLFLNSLYGKFGSNPDNYSEYTVIEPWHVAAAEQVDDYCFEAELGTWALVSRPLPEEKQHFYNVAVAASITGFVRAYLWRAISQCQGAIYCDTDSIACQDTGALELDPEKLGAWDIEADCDFGYVAGKKLYAFHTSAGAWKTASKGVRLDPDEIARIAQGEALTHTPINPSFSLKRGVGFISRKITRTG